MYFKHRVTENTYIVKSPLPARLGQTRPDAAQNPPAWDPLQVGGLSREFRSLQSHTQGTWFHPAFPRGGAGIPTESPVFSTRRKRHCPRSHGDTQSSPRGPVAQSPGLRRSDQADQVSGCGAVQEVTAWSGTGGDCLLPKLHGTPQGRLCMPASVTCHKATVRHDRCVTRIKDHENSLNVLHFEAPFGSKARPAKYRYLSPGGK